MGSNPAQGIESFSPNENVIQGLSVLGLFKLHIYIDIVMSTKENTSVGFNFKTFISTFLLHVILKIT